MCKTLFYVNIIILFDLGAVGFGSSGIVSGSVAAGIQSWIGNVAGGSLFAKLQSLGNLTDKYFPSYLIVVLQS